MNAKGFTLIEILVVIVLLGLLTGIAVSTTGGGSQKRELKDEASRLHALLRIAADEAVFTNQEIGVVIDNQGYEFLVYDEEESLWFNASANVLRPRSIPEWISVEFQREGKEKEIPVRESEDREYELDEEAQKNKKPQLMLLSSGEVTGFRISLQIDNDSDTRFEISSIEDGEITLKQPGQDS